MKEYTAELLAHARTLLVLSFGERAAEVLDERGPASDTIPPWASLLTKLLDIRIRFLEIYFLVVY